MSLTPEPGGPTTQTGIYFQNCVTVLRLADLLSGDQVSVPISGKVIAVRTEAPEEVDDTAVTWSNGRREFIQAKISLPTHGEAWAKLWKHMYSQYIATDFKRSLDGDIITLAVSWSPSMVSLQNILLRARTSETEVEWFDRLNNRQQVILENIKTIINLDDRPLFQFCSYVQAWILNFEGDPMETDTFDNEVHRKLQTTLDSTTNVFSVLMDLTGRTARIRGSWRFDDLAQYLTQRGFRFLSASSPAPPDEFQLLEPNPYRVGPPLRSPGDLFVGRESLLQSALWRIEKHSKDKMAPNVILLYGPHRSGKTSVLFRIVHRLGANFKAIYIDLNGIRLAEEPSSALAAIAGDIETALLNDGLSIPIPTQQQFLNDPVRSMGALMRNTAAVCAPSNPVLMLDESDTLYDFASNSSTISIFLSFLRKVVEQARNIFFIFASCKDIRWLSDPGISRLLTLADDYLRVDLLTETEVLALVMNPVAEYFTYADDAMDRILRLSGRHPCFVQLICHQAVEWRNQRRVNRISLDALNELLPEAVARGHQQFADLWNGLTRSERSVLYALSRTLESAETVSTGMVRARLKALQIHIEDWDPTLDRLLHMGLIDFHQENLTLHIRLLKHWFGRTPAHLLFPESPPASR